METILYSREDAFEILFTGFIHKQFFYAAESRAPRRLRIDGATSCITINLNHGILGYCSCKACGGKYREVEH